MPRNRDKSLPTRERELKRRRRSRRGVPARSLPTRERELKPPGLRCGFDHGAVAPHAGARIETCLPGCCEPSRRSLPTRERELKHNMLEQQLSNHGSLPTRERELKQAGLAHGADTRRRSLPSRERELKPQTVVWTKRSVRRSPRGSAN